ncbi:MAG: molybdate ABC transporter substrate-binding protein [Pseudomonadota bacterium]|nr:molybdate ABC transporter substrate-binding protein [Pseudomonadales bacterium]MDY6920860.1 molybdate ABC transporter substrate-binding protein [Pseudomonadota bacterium]
MANRKTLIRVLSLLFISPLVAAEQITIAVASNFTGPMEQIVARFQQQTGHQVRLSFGSSGKFFAQIQHHAPFQAFFSADQAKPRALEQAGLAVPGSRFTYAVGALVLWSADPERVDKAGRVLARGDFKRLALANPKLAPYGAAAVQTLAHLGLAESTRPRWVKGENISQTYQFVSSGNAELGFVALSQVMQRGEVRGGSHWRVPAEYHAPIRQDAVLLQRGADSDAARALLDFVQGPEARSIMAAFGYGAFND